MASNAARSRFNQQAFPPSFAGRHGDQQRRFAHWIGRTIKRIGLMIEVSRERRNLTKLNPDQLRDLGLSWSDALYEAERPFWDIPQKRWDEKH